MMGIRRGSIALCVSIILFLVVVSGSLFVLGYIPPKGRYPYDDAKSILLYPNISEAWSQKHIIDLDFNDSKSLSSVDYQIVAPDRFVVSGPKIAGSENSKHLQIDFYTSIDNMTKESSNDTIRVSIVAKYQYQYSVNAKVSNMSAIAGIYAKILLMDENILIHGKALKISGLMGAQRVYPCFYTLCLMFISFFVGRFL